MNKQTENSNLPGRGPGRPKGSRNKVTNLLKEAILEAGKNAGDGDLVAYLEKQARENPGPFMALLGKVLPMDVGLADGGTVNVQIVRFSDMPQEGAS
ncbi:MAG: hypothetical protein GY807_16680 [Gammaproteobacteria bacterium]|nr:hypothetical protein [Gammaproteobacteria bacterium]